MAESFDFQINDLKFRAATSDRFPYARATAPFRKEQFDAAPTVGDQSLSGWWTRGQLSFHKGAGIKYYEVLDGDEVLNRFTTSERVEVFDEPGAVTLLPTTDTPVASVTSTPVSLSAPATGSRFAWVDSADGYHRFDSGTVQAITSPSTGPKMITTAIAAHYVADGGGITRFGVASSDSTTATHLYSYSGGFTHAWYAKGRVWAVDPTGAVYALSTGTSGPYPIEVTDSDRLFTGEGTEWAFAASPGAVYLSSASVVYRVSIDNTGAVPTLTSGVVAAELAQGEIVKSLRYHLGHLVISTTRGVRAASVNPDDSLTVGPLIARGGGVGAPHSGVRGSIVYFLHKGLANEPAGTRLVGVNVTEPVGDLVFAFSTTNVDVGDVTGGVSSYADGLLVWGSRDGVSFIERHTNGPALASEGSVTTALHRFGTLEGKHFTGVKVRVAGDGGTVAAYLVEPGGAETLLTTIDTATDIGAEVSLVTNPPSEAVALKFVLQRSSTDPTVGPTLLGYQIKALPSPVRQRMLRWPLLVTDVIRDRYGVSRGTREGAWTAWSELETLEETDALVTFTDHRTGETGEAFIESLELQTDTPTRGANSGFGGVGYVTLRKVS